MIGKRSPHEWVPLACVVAFVAVLFVSSNALSFYAGSKSYLSACMAGQVEKVMKDSQSIVDGLRKALRD